MSCCFCPQGKVFPKHPWIPRKRLLLSSHSWFLASIFTKRMYLTPSSFAPSSASCQWFPFSSSVSSLDLWVAFQWPYICKILEHSFIDTNIVLPQKELWRNYMYCTRRDFFFDLSKAELLRVLYITFNREGSSLWAMKDVCLSWPHILPPRIQWHRRPSMMDAELMRQGRVWPSHSHGCSVCRGRGGSLITWKRLWMDKCVFGGMVSKGRKRIEKRDSYCVWFSRLPVEIGLQLPYGLEKQFLSNSFIIKEKDPFVNNTMHLSHVFLQRSCKYFRDFIFIKSWWVGVKTSWWIQPRCPWSNQFVCSPLTSGDDD